jgi:hypothetical protein
MNRTVFENVDVDVRSATALEHLHAAIVSKTHVLHVGRIGRTNHLRFALFSRSSGPAVAVRRLTRIIQALPAPATREWKNAKTREFDFGFSAGFDAEAAWVVPTEIIASVATVNAQVRITIYPAEQFK